MLKRYLEMVSPTPETVRELSFPDLIRAGCDQGLLLYPVAVWKEYRRERSMTSHTYDEVKASEVFSEIPRFLKEVRYLLQRLKEKATDYEQRN